MGMPEEAIAVLRNSLEEAEQLLQAGQTIGKRLDMARNKLSDVTQILESREEQWMKMAKSVEEAKLEVKEAHAALMELMREEAVDKHVQKLRGLGAGKDGFRRFRMLRGS